MEQKKTIMTKINDFKNVFTERRAINYFDTEKLLSDDILKDIINLAVTAPSAFNLQPWDIIAVKSKEAKKKLYGLASSQQKVIEAPITLIILGNRKGYETSNPIWEIQEKERGSEYVQKAKEMTQFLYGSTKERQIKFAESNTGLLAMSIMYAAKYYGVDSHPMSGIDFDGIKEAFDIQEDREAVMLIALGYFDNNKELYPKAYRRGFEEVVTIV